MESTLFVTCVNPTFLQSFERTNVARLEVGAKAPAFTLRNQNGDKVSLSSFAGTRVVLYFYPADDTPGCTKEACQFNDGLLAFKRLGVKVLGISPDDAPRTSRFARSTD